jgi:hypothetical protein
MKKSSASSKSTAVPNDKETNNSHTPNQYARVKYVTKGEDEIKDNQHQTKTRRANVVGFDHEAAVKRNLSIVSAITAVDLPDGISVILTIHETIYNDTANHSLLSECQLRDFGVKIDLICHKHGDLENGDSR